MGDHSMPKSAAAFRQAVDDRLKAQVKELGAPTTLNLLRRRFLHGTIQSAVGILAWHQSWPSRGAALAQKGGPQARPSSPVSGR